MLRRLVAQFVLLLSMATLGLLFLPQSHCGASFLSAKHALACAREDLSAAQIVQQTQPYIPIAVGFCFVLFAISMYFIAVINKKNLFSVPYLKTEGYLHLPRHGPHKIQGIKFILTPRHNLVIH